MGMIWTTKGDIDESQLVQKVSEVNQEGEIVMAREWYLGEELVRRDVWVNLKRGLEVGASAGVMNG